MNRISASHDAVAVSVKILAICREEPQSKVCLWVLRLILKDPEMLTRQVADAAENSNGSAYYVPLALVEKGFIKLGNFKTTLVKVIMPTCLPLKRSGRSLFCPRALLNASARNLKTSKLKFKHSRRRLVLQTRQSRLRGASINNVWAYLL